MNKKISTLVAAILAVLTVTTIGAYAAPSADLDQCRNGPADAPVNCTGDAWVNGNVGAQQGHLAEGWSIPYRTRMFQLPPNTQVSLVLGYDIKHSDANAIDYLTYFQRLDSPPGSHLFTFGHPPEIVDPTSGVAFTGPTTTFPIPAPSSAGTPIDDQPNASFNNLTAAEKIMTLFGGTITDIKYVTQGDLTASTSETRIMVNLTTNSTCPLVKVGSQFVQQCTAVLSWGGHIGSQVDWGAGNSAGGISGSPYHMRLISWNLGNLGNQDRSLAAAAVAVAPSAITIIKNTIPDSEQLFNYATTGTGLSPFSLKDNGTGLNSTSFGSLAAGTYTVTEDAVAGFNLTALSCTDPSGDTTTNLNARNATIVLAQGETVTCTFENTQNATLTIVKDAIPNSATDFSFTGSGAIGSFKLDDDADPTLPNSTTFSLEPGTYSVSETVPAGWNLTSATCTDGSAVASIGLSAGESVTCTFTNAKLHLKFIKEGALDFTNTNYAINVTNDGGANLTITNITDATSTSLTCDRTFPWELAPGDSIICSVSYPVDTDILSITTIEIAEPHKFWRV